MAVVVARERRSRMTLASMVPTKSTEGTFAARRVMAYLREIGCNQVRMTMKTDTEPAIVALVREIGRLRAAEGAEEMVVENSPAYSSASNGVVERGVQSVQGMVRTLRSATEEKLGVSLVPGHAIWAWLVEHAAFLLNRGEVGHDGKTAYERCKGTRGRMPGLVFAEKVLWKRRPVGGALGKLSCLWEDGIFLGIKATSGEYIVGTARGIKRTRTIARRPEEERWSADCLSYVGGVPWRMSEDDPKTDGEPMKMHVPEGVRPEATA